MGAAWGDPRPRTTGGQPMHTHRLPSPACLSVAALAALVGCGGSNDGAVTGDVVIANSGILPVSSVIGSFVAVAQ